MSKHTHCYVDFHVLQTLPPSCVNRDDTGSPKTAVYGGVTRARVSSQAWKRAIRMMFKDIFDDDKIGSRTTRAADMIAYEIKKLDPSCDAQKKAEEVLTNAGLGPKQGKTKALLFISKAQAEELARVAIKDETDKKTYKKLCKEALEKQPSVDMAMFGRMVAEDPSLNYDAAVQVAHSISTHEVHNEYDYFTAVDDLAPEDNAGAAHLGTVEFNSATMYRYATVGVDELAKSTGKDTGSAARKFAEAFVLSMPTGRQNTFANRTVPDMVYVTLRKDQPVNLVGAFEKPVLALSKGYVEASKEALISYANQVYGNFIEKPEISYICGSGERIKDLGEKMSFSDMLDKLEEDINDYLGGEDEI